MSLESYRQKRDFKKTPEPKGHVHKTKHFLFVVQKHAATHLHYNFRLELKGVLKSWAVPKGPCLDPKVKRLAIHVEDHPIEYGTFEGIIPKEEYGGGTVMLWDQGHWVPLDDDPEEAYHQGHLRFELNGKKIQGRWDLIRFKQNQWFLIKYDDEFAKSFSEYDVTKEEPRSVLNDQSIEEISRNYQGVWSKNKANPRADFIDPELKASLQTSPFLKTISAQLATLVDKPPKGDNWLHEIKFDGYRMVAFKKGDKIRFVSRNQKDWTTEFHQLIPDLQKLPVENGIFDGEIVALDERSRSNFQLLQNSIKSEKQSSLFYYIFDLLYLEQYDLRSLPLIERKKILTTILEEAPLSIKYSDHVVGQGEAMFKHSCDFALEGIVSKRADSRYLGKRSKSWLKIKCSKRQEFVVGGFTKPKGSRKHFGSLYLGVFNEDKELVFIGNVGTGFTDKSLEEIYNELKPLEIKKNPFNEFPPEAKTATWVKPKLIVEVEFSEWTDEGRLRHPSFKGLRTDKKAQEVIKEKERSLESIESEPPAMMGNPQKLSSPEKILYKEDKISKQDLYDYYDKISDYILPYILNRPLTLVRCPNNYKECFYQKHLNKGLTKLHEVPVKNKKGEVEQYLYLDNKEGLLNLVQMGVLEIHPWGSTINHLEHPDILIFDLDPAPDVEWKMVVEAAFDIREQLQQYELTSFVKTTGGKGLHIVIPVKAEYDWDEVKNFTRVFVEFLEKRNPEKYISKMTKAKRKGKIFIDYLRNQRDATAIAPYSTRARIHAPIATPIRWDELSEQYEDTFYTIRTVLKRLQALKTDPWRGFWTLSQSLRLNEL